MSDLNNQAATTTASASGEPVSGASAPVQAALSGSTNTQVGTPSTASNLIPTATEADTPQTTTVSTTAPAGTVGEQGNVSPSASLFTESPTSGGSSSAAQSDVNVSTLGASVSTGEQGNVQPIPSPTSAPVVQATSATDVSVAGAGEQGNASPASGDSKQDENAAVSTITDQAAADAASRVLVVQTPATDTQAGSPTGGPIAGRGDTPEAKAKHGFLDRIHDDLRAELHAIEGLPQYVLHILSAVFDRHHSHVDNEAQ